MRERDGKVSELMTEKLQDASGEKVSTGDPVQDWINSLETYESQVLLEF